MMLGGLGIALLGGISSAHAANTICRGGSQAAYSQAIKQAIGAQMTSQGISYSAIFVAITANDRQASLAPSTFDATSQVSVSKEPLNVVFNGELPPATECAIPGTLTITVVNGNVAVLNKTQAVTINGIQAAAPKKATKSSKSKKRR